MVVVYSQPGCMPCRFTKERLKTREVEYREVDVTQDPEAFDYVKSLGYQQTPVVVTPAGEHWGGLRPDLIDAL